MMNSTSTDRLQQGFSVRGRVQGVGFRRWTQRTGSELGLVGAVWNRPDGAVEVHVIGPAPAVEAFATELSQGPQGAQVDGLERFASDCSLPSRFVIE